MSRVRRRRGAAFFVLFVFIVALLMDYRIGVVVSYIFWVVGLSLDGMEGRGNIGG